MVTSIHCFGNTSSNHIMFSKLHKNSLPFGGSSFNRMFGILPGVGFVFLHLFNVRLISVIMMSLFMPFDFGSLLFIGSRPVLKCSWMLFLYFRNCSEKFSSLEFAANVVASSAAIFVLSGMISPLISIKFGMFVEVFLPLILLILL